MAQQLTPKLRTEYQGLFESCLVRSDHGDAVDRYAKSIVANQARYQKVAKGSGVPWYAIGLIHAMEASLDFTKHLHNGDPLTARTTHVPSGRPPGGRPPFTWEQSARDALKQQGWTSWSDWSPSGILFKLELYNGWGYRQYHPTCLSPYLWSYTNHYSAGKYVADGKWSATAVSEQVGAAAILKRLVQLGAVGGSTGPRALALANPHMIGDDVIRAQQLLAKNPYGVFLADKPDTEYGPITAAAVKAAKWALGYPGPQVNTSYGPGLEALLSGKKPLPPGYEKTRQARMKAAPSEDAIRKKIVQWALWGVKNEGRIAYSQGGTRLAGLGSPGLLPLATDCSAFATLVYNWSGAPNPNCAGTYDPAKECYTGSMLGHCRRLAPKGVKPGDLVIFTPPSTGEHVCIVVSTGADPWLVSHGSDSGPKKLRFSDELAYQAGQGHGDVVWLSPFGV